MIVSLNPNVTVRKSNNNSKVTNKPTFGRLSGAEAIQLHDSVRFAHAGNDVTRLGVLATKALSHLGDPTNTPGAKAQLAGALNLIARNYKHLLPQGVPLH